MDDDGRTREINRFAREFGARLDVGERGLCDGPFWGDRMSGLGFEMDCWNSFDKAYGTHSAETPEVLGNGAYSQWRYINHWAESENVHDLDALRMMLSRLEELTATGA